jgi:hypothetical protein
MRTSLTDKVRKEHRGKNMERRVGRISKTSPMTRHCGMGREVRD